MFNPTYKINRGGREYDEGRVPAWTDRVFWRRWEEEENGVGVKLKEYGRKEVGGSDHYPVFGVFEVEWNEKREGVVRRRDEGKVCWC